jgi:hypothetical protein
MAMKHIIDVMEVLEGRGILPDYIEEFLTARGIEESEITFETIKEKKGSTLFVKVIIQGSAGKSNALELYSEESLSTEGDRKVEPTLGIIGRLGGMGARPQVQGFVSDADGAIAALAAAAALGKMRDMGDHLAGDVILTTHLCPDAPTIPHDPVPFMDSPVSMATMNTHEVVEAMDAVLSIDSTKGNRVINHRGFAISPTVKDGYILRVSEDLLDIMQNVTGRLPVVFPVTTQDITPYGNEVYHLNSILQPATATSAPVVGVALTSEIPVPGCATGANQVTDLEAAVRFAVETAKAYCSGRCSFYDEGEFQRLLELYGSMERLKTTGIS